MAASTTSEMKAVSTTSEIMAASTTSGMKVKKLQHITTVIYHRQHYNYTACICSQ